MPFWTFLYKKNKQVEATLSNSFLGICFLQIIEEHLNDQYINERRSSAKLWMKCCQMILKILKKLEDINYLGWIMVYSVFEINIQKLWCFFRKFVKTGKVITFCNSCMHIL